MPRTHTTARRVRILLVGLLVGLAGVAGPSAQAASTPSAQAGSAQTARYIIRLADPPLASYRGGIAGLAPTNPAVLHRVKLDIASPASLAYLGYLAGRHHALAATMTAILGHQVAVLFDYRYAFDGIAAQLTPAQAGVVRGLPGVADVRPDFERHIVDEAGTSWIGAPALWNGTATAGAPGNEGEGIVIGVIDTGVNVNHPSFAEVGADGYHNRNPRGRFYGLCAPLSGAPFCNDKLIGVHDLTGTTPFDDNGHGSHTASTAAGNVVKADLTAPTTSLTEEISGVAPHANLITYKACIVIGSCIGTSLVAAIDAATADGVDVINFSIGSGSDDPWNDPDAQAFLGARDAGVLSVVSAGNSGPGPGTIDSPADAPWVLAVGASTHDQALVSSLTGLTGGSTPPPGDIQGRSLTAGYGPAPIVYAGTYGDPLCSRTFLPGTFHGEIVICDRGDNARLDKGRNVRLGGAGGMVLANAETDGETALADAHELPALGIGYTEGEALKHWVASGTGQRASIAATTVLRDPGLADEMAGFSSRGPDTPLPDVIKPDVAAPGVDVLAAVNSKDPVDPPQFGLMSGTSMAGPHAAGAAALVRALHPDWTPAEVISALTSTSHTAGLRREDDKTAADPFDRGAGRIDLVQVGRAGLVLDQTTAGFRAANPANHGEPSSLNLTTMARQGCHDHCSWQRTVTNKLATTTTWQAGASTQHGMKLTVEPDRIRLAPGESAVLTVTADIADLPDTTWAFGTVTLTALSPHGGSSAVAAQHLTVAVLPGTVPAVPPPPNDLGLPLALMAGPPTPAVRRRRGDRAHRRR